MNTLFIIGITCLVLVGLVYAGAKFKAMKNELARKNADEKIRLEEEARLNRANKFITDIRNTIERRMESCNDIVFADSVRRHYCLNAGIDILNFEKYSGYRKGKFMKREDVSKGEYNYLEGKLAVLDSLSDDIDAQLDLCRIMAAMLATADFGG